MKKLSIYGFLRTALCVISIIAISMLFFLNFAYNASVSYNASEKVSFEGHIVKSIIMLVIVAVILFIMSKTKRIAQKISPKMLFIVLSALYSIMAIYLIANVDQNIRADAGIVFKTAKDFSKGIYTAFKSGGYIDRSPHQVGLLFYDSILQIFSKVPTVSFITNFIFVIGINYFTVKIADLVFKDKTTTLITTFVAFSFLPQFFFILFAYGLIPGFFFMTLGFYNAIKFSYEKRIPNAVYAVIGASVAAFFKQNFLIGAIAILIYLILRLFAERGKEKLKFLVVALCLVAFLFVPTEAVKIYYRAKTDTKLDQGTPAILWVAMGTDIDNRYLGPGWYTGFNYSGYTQSEYNSEKATELGIKKLEENIAKIKAEPKKAMDFFIDKTKSQWCEPMFQSVWSGPLEDCNQKTHTELLRSIYTGKRAESVVADLAKMILISVLFFTFVFLVRCSGKHDGWEIALMFIVGGLIFHTFWEGKSQYTYPYVFTLIPFACHGIKITVVKFGNVLQKKNRTSVDSEQCDANEISQ